MQVRATTALTLFSLIMGGFFLAVYEDNGSARTSGIHPHTEVACSKCHNFKAIGDSTLGKGNSAELAEKCQECHGSVAALKRGDDFFHQISKKSCVGCHSFHHTDNVTIMGDSTTIFAASQELPTCRDCHPNGHVPQVGPGHQRASKVIHADREGKFIAQPSAFCESCHDASKKRAANLGEEPIPPRFNLAASHPYDIQLIPGYPESGSTHRLQAEIPAFISTMNGRIICQTCHSLTSTNSNLLVTANEESELCTGCHDMNRNSGQAKQFTAK